MTSERENAIRRIKTAKGQLEGIIKMIEDERYCIDISNQLLASIALLKAANVSILNGHLKHGYGTFSSIIVPIKPYFSSNISQWET